MHTEEYLSVHDALEAVNAAQVLGLGVRLRNEMRVVESDETSSISDEWWIVDLLGRAPSDEDELD